MTLSFSRNSQTGTGQGNELSLGTHQLEEVTKYKYLGTIIDNKLSFKHHLSQILNRVGHKLYLLRKIRGSLTEKAARDIYTMAILPYIDMSDIIYAIGPATKINKLQILQNQAIRLIKKLPPRTNVDEQHKELKLQPLAIRREIHLLETAFYMAQNPSNRETISRPTRSQAEGRLNLRTARINVTKYQNTFTHRSAIAWNALPTDIHKIEHKKVFKMMVTKLLVDDEPMLGAPDTP